MTDREQGATQIGTGISEEALIAGLQRLGEQLEVSPPSIQELRERVQARHDARPSVRLKTALATAGSVALEATGFGHGFGGFEGTDRIGKPSYGEGGQVYSAVDRITKKVATFGGIAGGAYLLNKFGVPTL